MSTTTETGDKRSILLRPEDWSPKVAGAVVFVLVFVVVGFVALLVLGLVSNDTTTTTTAAQPQVVVSARLQQVQNCLETAGIGSSTDGLDFIAANASGGAVKARVQDNVVTISDGLSPAGAVGVVHGYRRLSQNLPLTRILVQQGRFALLWGKPPTRLERVAVARCLR